MLAQKRASNIGRFYLLEVKREIETEILVAKEAATFVKRQPDNIKMVLGLYLLSLYGLRQGLIMRASYLPIRFVDDLLDGDVPKEKGDPITYAQELSEHITTNSLDRTPIERQLRYALDALESKARPSDNPRGDFVKVIGTIIFDRMRASERKTLSANEIEQYYRNAFDPVINITLMALDSKFRSKDVPALSYGQGRVYSARDFKEDWERGIINVPGRAISLAGLSPTSAFESVSKNANITNWFHQSLASTKQDLLDTKLLLFQ